MSNWVGKEPRQSCPTIDGLQRRLNEIASEAVSIARDIEEVRDINAELRDQRTEALEICDRLDAENDELRSRIVELEDQLESQRASVEAHQ